MNKLSIGMKVALGFGIVLIMFIIVSVVTIQNSKQLQEDDKLVEHTYEVLAKIELVLGDLKDAETGQRGYLITGIENYLEPYSTAILSLQTNVAELKQLTGDNNNQQRRIDELKALITKKFAELQQTIDLRRNTSFEAAQEVVITDAGKQVMDNIRSLLIDMTNEEKTLLEERGIISNETSEAANTAIVWLTIIACIIVIILIIYYTRIISYPIKNLSQIAKEIALGKLNGDVITTSSNDEIGVLSRSFKLMQQNLRKNAEQANQIANGNLTIDVTPLSKDDIMGIAFASMLENLRQQIREITDGVNVLSYSTSEIMASTSQLAASAAETVTSISETSATIEEIRQTAEVSNEKATQVSETAKKVANISIEGTKSIEETRNGMNKIKQQMESIAGIVVRLSDQSLSIRDISNSVNDLAEQSNLLAVNASIEAAKAGEQGKGFAVVAQEIKNLAKRSKESTAQIRTILGDIQKAIGSAVMATEQGGKVIDEGLELSASANIVINTLSKGVEEASLTNIQIAATSQQQVIGMDQITMAVQNIKEASLQTASSTKQSEKSVSELHHLGEKLQEILKLYKLE